MKKNNLCLEKMNEIEAKQICEWNYEHPYDVYNWGSWEELKIEDEGIVKPEIRKRDYRGVYQDKDFIGFIYFNPIGKDHIRLGLGIAPEKTGRGLGTDLMELAVAEAEKRGTDCIIDLEVLTWNERAIKTYQRAGFKVVDTYKRRTPTGEAEFHLMEYRPDF